MANQIYAHRARIRYGRCIIRKLPQYQSKYILRYPNNENGFRVVAIRT